MRKRKKSLKNRLGTLEGKIGELEKELSEMDYRLHMHYDETVSQPDFFDTYQARKTELEGLMEQWEALSAEWEALD